MSSNRISGAAWRQHSAGAIIVAAGAAVLTAWAVLLVGAGIASASHGGPHINIDPPSGNTLTAEVRNADEVTVDESSWKWISYDADVVPNDFSGCVADSFGLSDSDAPLSYNSGTGSEVVLTSADNDLTYCFMVSDTDGESNTLKYPDLNKGDSPINIGNNAGYDDSDAGKPGNIADTGVGGDILTGSLFIIGIAASVACSKIWLDTYKRHRAKQQSS